MTGSLPSYPQERKIASGVAYYWTVPKHCRPDIQVRQLALGTDREAACAVARRMLADADRVAGHVGTDLERKTRLARRFATLDAVSRDSRALSNAESEELEQIMKDLRMVPL